MPGDHEDLRDRLASVAEALTERSIDRLRASLGDGGQTFPEEEKQLTRARRSVEKAIEILRRIDEPPDAEPDW